MNATELVQEAQAATGLQRFGDDSFREGLEKLVGALDEASLNALGWASMRAQIVGLLSQRLQVADWYERHPEIEDEEITAPLIGLGLPRTGSTALACLLGEDRNVRSLRTWESISPCPPPGAVDMANDPRMAAAEAGMERRARLFPRMTAMLPSTAASPTECQLLMGQDFQSQIFQAFAQIPSYVAWLNEEADLVPTYRYVKRVLKLLQWRRPPGRWRLKNPSHSLFIGALDAVFPDARFVMTHRDVAEVIPSVADVYLEMHRAYSDRPDMAGIGRIAGDFCELGMRRMMAFRDAGAEPRFFDIEFAPFQRDPFPILERLYAFLDEELTADTRARMQAWRRAAPPGKPYPRTDMAAFGLDAEALRRRFRFYSERFGLAAGAPGIREAVNDDAGV